MFYLLTPAEKEPFKRRISCIHLEAEYTLSMSLSIATFQGKLFLYELLERFLLVILNQVQPRLLN